MTLPSPDVASAAISTRRTAHSFSIRVLPWPVWVALGALLAGAGLFVLPVPGGDWPSALVAGICPQRPGHSLFLAGQQLPLEARMTGIFGGFLVATSVHWFAGRGLARDFGRWWVLPLAVLLILVMGFDGVNALLTDVGGPGLYPPNNALRLMTGLLAGGGLSLILTPILAQIIWHQTTGSSVLAGWRDVLLPAVALAVLGLAGVSGAGILYGLLSIVSVLGVVALVAVLNVVMLLVVGDQDGRITRIGPLSGWLSVATGLALVELAGLALLRWWLTAALGIHWEAL